MAENAAEAREMARKSENDGDWKAALTFYNDVIFHATEDPDRAQAYLAKARILGAHLGLGAKAEEHLARALEHDPGIPAAWVRYADCALDRGEWAEATARAERGLPHAGTGPEGEWLVECIAVGKSPAPASISAGLRARVPASAR